MPARTLTRRLDRIEMNQGQTSSEIGRMVFVTPSQWPAPVQGAYAAAKASGDLVAQADIVEQQTGERPTFPARSRRGASLAAPAIIEIITRPDGPQ